MQTLTDKQKKELVLFNLKLAKSFIEETIKEIDNLNIFDEDIKISEKLCDLATETKNQIIYNGVLPF